MHRAHRLRLLRAIVACAAAVASSQAAAQTYGGTLMQLGEGGWLHEGDSRVLPGIYYFEKGCDYARRDEMASAMNAWTIAAGWAMKEAQYDLGIAYFRGDRIAADRPLGLAWLALAAERKDPEFEESLAAAWDHATPVEQAAANRHYRELLARYGDAVALPRAERRYDQEVAHLTGSRVGTPGHVRVYSREGAFDGATWRSRVDFLADINFGRLPKGRVDVGPLEPAEDSER